VAEGSPQGVLARYMAAGTMGYLNDAGEIVIPDPGSGPAVTGVGILRAPSTPDMIDQAARLLRRLADTPSNLHALGPDRLEEHAVLGLMAKGLASRLTTRSAALRQPPPAPDPEPRRPPALRLADRAIARLAAAAERCAYDVNVAAQRRLDSDGDTDPYND
jgi:hypothetical protein